MKIEFLVLGALDLEQCFSQKMDNLKGYNQNLWLGLEVRICIFTSNPDQLMYRHLKICI